MANVILWYNNATTTLAGAISAGATSCQVAAGAGSMFSPGPSAGQYFTLTFNDAATGLLTEIVHVTAVSGDTLTIVRAQEGTAAQSWNAGDLASNFITAGSLSALAQASSLQTPPTYAADTGSANAYVATYSPAIASRTTGQALRVKVANTNTGPSTFNPGPGAVSIVRSDGSALRPNDMLAGAIVTLTDNGTSYQLSDANSNVRVVASGVVTFYVSPGGNDSNPGTAALPWQTLTGAFNNMARYWDFAGFNPILQASGPSTFTSGLDANGTLVGAGSFTLVGATGTPSQATVDTFIIQCGNSSAQPNCIRSNGIIVNVQGFLVETSGSALNCITTTNGGQVNLSYTDLGPCAQAQVLASNGGRVYLSGSNWVSGNAASAMLDAGGAGAMISVNGDLYIQSGANTTPTYALTGALGYIFAPASGLTIHNSVVSPTGQSFLCGACGVILEGLGPTTTHFPGSAGSPGSNGGQHV